MATRKLAVVMGVANQRSIASAAVTSLTENGFDCILTTQSDRFRTFTDSLMADNKSILSTISCNVEKEGLPKLFSEKIPEELHRHGIDKRTIDTVVHSIAFADFENTTLGNASLEAFLRAQHISAYSFLEMARCSQPLLTPGNSSLTTLSYLGAVRAVPNYHIMGPAKASLEALVRGLAVEYGPLGVRVNAVSAGPIKTLAARGIPDFNTMSQQAAQGSPLQRSVTTREVADTVSFLATSGTGITGQTIYVDGGFSAVVPR